MNIKEIHQEGNGVNIVCGRKCSRCGIMNTADGRSACICGRMENIMRWFG